MRSVASKLLNGVLLVLGVTFISFLLMVWFGPDQTYTLIGKNASPGQIEDVRRQPGYDHSYFFIASFIDDHLRHHAAALGL